MKKIFSYIVLLAAVTMFTACGNDDATYEPTPKLEVASADVLFEADGGDGSVVVNASGTVSATTDASWLTLSVQGNKVAVKANPNLSLEGRSALIKITSGSTEAEVTATQKSSKYGIPSLEYQIADYNAKLAIPVVHNQPVTISNDTPWMTVVFNEETNQIEIVAQNNDEADARQGTFTITMGQYSEKVTINQIGILLEPEKKEVNVKNEAQSVSVNVNHTRAVTVKSNDDWITAKWDAKNNVLTLDLAANETGWRRTGTVTISSSPASETITVTQFDFAKDIQGEYYFAYYSSGAWKSMDVVLATTSDTEGTLTWKGRYSNTTGPFVIPITLDAETETFALPNMYDMEQTWTNEGTEYKLTTMVMFTDGEKLYRARETNLPSATAALSEDEEGIHFDFSINYGDYQFYALRIGYGAGGYDGIAGNFVTYPYCYLLKK